DGGLERVVRDRREAREPFGMCRAKPGEPLVVDAGDLDRGLAVGEPSRHAEDPVEHLGLHAVAVLVHDPQLGLGEAADPFLAVVVEAGGGHAVGAIDASGHVLAPARSHATGETQVGALRRGPERSLRTTAKGATLGLACGMGSGGREYVPGRIY